MPRYRREPWAVGTQRKSHARVGKRAPASEILTFLPFTADCRSQWQARVTAVPTRSAGMVLALAVCAKLLTIEISFTGNRHCLFSNSPPGRQPGAECAAARDAPGFQKFYRVQFSGRAGIFRKNSWAAYLADRCRGVSVSSVQMPCRSGSPHGVFRTGAGAGVVPHSRCGRKNFKFPGNKSSMSEFKQSVPAVRNPAYRSRRIWPPRGPSPLPPSYAPEEPGRPSIEGRA
jgi:hypothetical protein